MAGWPIRIFLARPSRNQRRLILAIHRFRRWRQIKDPNVNRGAGSLGAVSCRGGCANRLSTGPWHKGLDKFEFAVARFTCSGDVPIAGESCLRRRGRRRYRAPSSISDPSIKTTHHSPSRPPVSSMPFVVQNPRGKTTFSQIVLQSDIQKGLALRLRNRQRSRRRT